MRVMISVCLEEQKKGKKKEKSSKAVYESAQCMLPTHWDL